MPLSKIHVPARISEGLRRALAEQLHASLVETCEVHEDDDFSLITAYSDGEMILHPSFMGDRDVHSTIIVEITLLAGRTETQKEALYQNFRVGLANLGLSPENAIIYLLENGPVDWSFSTIGSIKTARAG